MAKAKDDETKTVGTGPEERIEGVPFQVSEPAGDIPERVYRACEAYGIEPLFLLAWKEEDESGHAVLLTQGGKKVSWNEGKKVEKLTEIEVTGIGPPRKSKLLK